MPKPIEREQPQQREMTEADVAAELQTAARKLNFGFTFQQSICNDMADGVMNKSGYSFRIPTSDEKKVKAFVAEIEKNICGRIRGGLKEDEGEYIRVTMEKKDGEYKISIDRTPPRKLNEFAGDQI